MKDPLEQDIRHLYGDTGPLEREAAAWLLLALLERIQSLEAKLKEKNHG
jgi:hypothetical protein